MKYFRSLCRIQTLSGTRMIGSLCVACSLLCN